MKSRGLPGSEEAADRSWVRRVVVGGLGTAGATVALAAFAASAFANAANPTATSATETVNQNGSVTVVVSGSWSWGELAGVQTSPQNNCDGRSGVGWSVDWWGMSTSPTAKSISPLTGSLVTPAASSTSGPTLTNGALAPTQNWQVKSGAASGQFFHTSSLFNGFEANLCPKTPANPGGNPDITLDANGAPSGHWSATATYPNLASVPPQICANFYDPHGSLGKFSTSAGDNTTADGDNSIKTNNFDPTNVQGNCSVPVLVNPTINVDKTNNASSPNSFQKTGQVANAGQAVTFQAVISNPASNKQTLTIDSFSDAITQGVGNVGPVTCSNANGSVINQTIPAGGSVTCTFSVPNYIATFLKAGDNQVVDTITVTGHGSTGSTGPVTSSSTVLAPAGSPSLDVTKSGPSTGVASQTGDYTVTLTNTGTATANGPITFFDRLPTGETFVSTTGASDAGMSCSANGQLVTCTYSKDLAKGASANVVVRVRYAAGTEGQTLTDCVGLDASKAVPGTARADQCVDTKIKEPNLVVQKTGSDTGVPGGSGAYDITVTNNGNAPATAVSFVDNLPTDESFVSASGDFNCTQTSATKISCTAKSGLLPLAQNDSLSAHILVTYALTTREGDRLTDCAILPNLNQSCKTTVIHTPDVVISKVGPATGVAGDRGTYTISVKNNGQAVANNVTFTDNLPVGESYFSFNSSAITCALSANPQVVNCSLNGPLAVGASASVDVTVTYALDSAGKTLTDCAVLMQGNQSCVPTKIPGKPSISVVKTNDADGDGVFHDTETAANPGDPVTFKVVVTNTGPEPVIIDTVTDAFDATTLAECPNLIGITLGNGDSVTCTFTVDNYAPAAGSSLTDTVTVGGHQTPGGPPVSGSDTSTVKTANPKQPGPDLAIVKTADQDKVRAGDTLTYTLSVTNVGDGPTTGTTTVTDTIPDGLDLVSVGTGSGWDCTTSGRSITCTYAAIVAVGETLPDITIVTTVNDTAVGSVVNTGVVSTPGDVNPLNDRSTVKTPVTKVLPEKIVKPTTPTQVLPFTGDRTGQMLPVGLGALLLGLMLVAAGRRRRTA